MVDISFDRWYIPRDAMLSMNASRTKGNAIADMNGTEKYISEP
jgi:hypothetical protein